MKITLIGGDARTLALARYFRGAGHTALCFCTQDGGEAGLDLATALHGAHAVILPLPASRDGIHPTAAQGVTPPTLTEIFRAADGGCLFLGGKLSPAVCAAAVAEDVSLSDYYAGENILQKNAVATAEAAVAMAALDLPVTLFGTEVAILGAGRIAMRLLSLLQAMGARVSLYARSPSARERAAAAGATVFPIKEGVAPAIPPTVRAVFSTVPAMLFPRGSGMPARGTYFYDLGGGAIDATAAEEAGLILPPSAALPGRYSPESAARYIFEEILRLLAVRGEGEV
jgi:dipicolinate synthase subunit A